MIKKLKFKNAEDGIEFYQSVKQFIRTSKAIDKLHKIPYKTKKGFEKEIQKDLDYHEAVKQTAIALIANAVKKAIPADDSPDNKKEYIPAVDLYKRINDVLRKFAEEQFAKEKEQNKE